MRKKVITPEEKAAKVIENVLSDLRLDLDLTGIYLATFAPTVLYNRLMLIAESAEFEKERANDRTNHNPLF